MTQYEQAMQRLQAYKFELIVTGEQQRQMRRFSGACRFVYNKALALQKTGHEQGEKKLSAFELNLVFFVKVFWRGILTNTLTQSTSQA